MRFLIIKTVIALLLVSIGTDTVLVNQINQDFIAVSYNMDEMKSEKLLEEEVNKLEFSFHSKNFKFQNKRLAYYIPSSISIYISDYAQLPEMPPEI